MHEQSLTGSQPTHSSAMCAIVGDHIASTTLHESNSPPDLGAAYLFQFQRGSWAARQRMISNEIDDNYPYFGAAVSLSDQFVLVGDPAGQGLSFTTVGAVYVFDVQQPDCNENGIIDYCELPDCNGNHVPDDCDIANGLSQDCNGNNVPDECEAAVDYLLDDGTPGTIWGAFGPFGVDYFWLNRFVVQPGKEVITYVELPWSKLTVEGEPATILLYGDPNNDGDPNDAILLQAVPTMTFHSTDTVTQQTFVRIRVPPTFVGFPGTSFFVAVLQTSPFGNNVAPSDESLPHQMQSWQRLAIAGTIDIAHPSLGGPIVLKPTRNWILRAIAHDCDGNGVWNQCDIANGAADRNHNGIPDACERLCPADVAPVGGNGAVDIDDLAYLITHWLDTRGLADLNHDGVVNIDDLDLLIIHWGPCA